MHAVIQPLAADSARSAIQIAALSREMNPAVSRSSFIMHNTYGKTIVAYVIRWDVEDGSGTRSFYQAFDDLEHTDNPTRPLGFGLEAGQRRIVNPLINAHERSADSVETIGRMKSLQERHPLARTLASARSVAPALDVVIFSDGHWEGKNDSGLAHAFTAERNAKHDAGLSMLIASTKGESAEQLRDRLHNSVALGKDLQSARLGTEAGYTVARAKWAEYLLTVQERAGNDAMLIRARIFAQLPLIRLSQ